MGKMVLEESFFVVCIVSQVGLVMDTTPPRKHVPKVVERIVHFFCKVQN